MRNTPTTNLLENLGYFLSLRSCFICAKVCGLKRLELSLNIIKLPGLNQVGIFLKNKGIVKALVFKKHGP